MWQTLLAHTGDSEMAADAVAEAFAQGLRRGPAVREPAAWAWRSAFRIADGMLADRRRVDRSRTSSEDIRSIAGSDALPDDVVALLDALGRLPNDSRRLVLLSLVGGLDAAEIGELVGARPGTVRVRLHRALVRLRSSLSTDADGAAGPPTPAGLPSEPPPHPGVTQ